MKPSQLSSARRRAGVAAVAALAGVVIAGCGQVANTIHPAPYNANQVTVALAGPPNAFYAGLYEAQAKGYFKQSAIDLHIVTPSTSQDALTMVHDGKALIGMASQPSVLLHRNQDQPLVSVAALVQGPLPAITIVAPKTSPSGPPGTTTTGTGTTTTRTAAAPHAGTSTATTPTTTTTTPATTTTSPAATTTTASEPDAASWPPSLQQLLAQPGAPTYNGLNVVVRKATIVDHPGLVRRFVQTVARGYRAARADPQQAIDSLVAAVPSLKPDKALEMNTLDAAIPYFFPAGGKVWGWQHESAWNSFGEWLHTHNLIQNPNAIVAASTNELLQGQGV